MTGTGTVVVDDDPLMLGLLEPKLRPTEIGRWGEIRTFQTPDAALAWIEQQTTPPRLVISDFNLKAGMTGLDVLARVARTTPETIRILMSGYSREQIGIREDAPIHGFVEKELRVDDIVRQIDEIARRQAAAPSTAPPSDGPGSSRPTEDPSDIFQRFVGTTQDFAIFTLDKNGIVTSWNPGAERIKGWKPKEIIGRHFSTFYPAADIASHKPRYVLQRALEDGRFEDEGWRVRKDGSMFWANAVVTAVREDGKLRGFVKVTRDLTARRHAEEAVRQSEERYRLFIESVKDYAMFVLDTTGHVMSWNQGAERLKGYKAEEIVGRHFSNFYTQPDRDRHHPEEELAIALREGRYEEEGWRVKKDGSHFWANVTITTLFDNEHRHIGFAKVTRDLSERKKAEESLRQRADSYAELNRELDAFSHSVAHDLRAPVRAMMALSEGLLHDARERLTAEDVRTLEAMLASSKQMALLIQDLLDLSLTARQQPHRKDADLTALARRAVEEKARAYPDRVVQARIAPGMRGNVDERLMLVAIGNLVDNAIKFTREREAVVEIGQDSDGWFFVRDHGVGFPTEQAGKLFQPFSRLHTGNEFPGTGIGLTIVERIIRRHGGKIRAESEEGKGTTFRFTLA